MSSFKILYYLAAFPLAGYFLMKLVERDPETVRQDLPERHERDYETASQKRNAAFMSVLKGAAQGDSPEVAVRKAREQWEKEMVTKKSS